MVVTPHHGLQLIPPIRIETETEAHLTLKDPPGDLNEGEQFQIKFSVRSSSSSPIKVPVSTFLLLYFPLMLVVTSMSQCYFGFGSSLVFLAVV